MDPKDCLFCKIVSGEIPSKKVYEDERSYVMLDINPRNPGHMLVIPKNHYETIFEIPENEVAEVFKTVKRMADKCRSGVSAEGISIAQSNGRAAGQMVQHMHFHVIPRFSTEGPPGLESILPVKKMDEQSLDKLVEALQKAETGKPSGTARPAKPKPEKTAKEADSIESTGKEEIDFKF